MSKHVQRKRTQFAVAGGSVSVGRYISGRPDCFMVRAKAPDLRQGHGRKVLKIVVNVGARAGVTPEVMFTRGAAAVALVNALEANSYRCELWMVSLAASKTGQGGINVRVKRADEPAHLDELAFCFAHAATHRWLMFSVRTGVPALANLRHLILFLDELQALGVAFVSLAEGIDATTPAGRLQLHILGAIAEFERDRIRERVMAGLQRARAQGKRLGRPRNGPATIDVPGGSVRAAALAWGVSKSTAARRIARAQ